MSNPHKEFSTSWAAYEKQAAARGIGTGTAQNAQYLNEYAAQNQSGTDGTNWGPAYNPPSFGTPAGRIARGTAQGLSEGIVKLGLLLLVIMPVAIYTYTRTESLLGAIAIWAVMVWAMSRLTALRPVAFLCRWLGRFVVLAVALHALVAAEIATGPFATADRAIMAQYDSLRQAYLAHPYVRDAIVFVQGRG